ncbi:MAG: hypothetical protein ABR597_09970 [Bacteroidales bacterium]
MKCTLWLMIFFMCCRPVLAQNISAKCAEGAENFSVEVTKAMLDGNDETLAELLFTWEQECGLTEPVFRARALQLIADGRFPGPLDESLLLEKAVAFEIRYRINTEESPSVRDFFYEEYEEYFGYVPLNEDFDRQTLRIANRLKNQVDKNTLEYRLLELYSGNTESFFLALKEGGFAETPLARDYNKRVAELLKLPEINLGVRAGTWFPMSDLDILGVHPALGVNLGIKKNRNYLDAIFDIRFGKAANPVTLVVQDTLVTTSNFQGAYMGLEWSRVLVKGTGYEIELFAGAGYDVIDLIEEGQDPERQTFGSVAAYFGPSYRYIFANRTWLSLRPGFYLLNHKHEGGSSFKGNAWSFSIVFGFSDNARKTENLRRLGFERW